jgi:acyl dehydratase
MVTQREKLWDFDAVQQGQKGPVTEVHLTPELIAEYALSSQNPDPRFQQAGASPEYGGGIVAMPTMVLCYAPLMREDIAEASGFVAFEKSVTARRQTPFAKCEVSWSRPARPGDTITGTRRVLEKYERRGNRFVVFRVEATNQDRETVAEYDYTCIFDYAPGQKPAPGPDAGAAPRDDGTPQPATTPPSPESKSSGASLLTAFDAVSIGDKLASLSISESQEIINRKDAFRLAGGPPSGNIHTDEEFARQNIFNGIVASGPAAMSYVDQMLQRSFPLSAFHHGGRLLMRAIEPFRVGDTVTLQGEVMAKQPALPSEGQGGGMVECRIKGINQRGDLVNLSDASLFLP